MFGLTRKPRKSRAAPIKEHKIQELTFDAFKLMLPDSAVRMAIPNGDRKVTTTPGFLAGASDIHILWNKISIYIEMKSKYGEQSDKQKEFEQRITAAGGHYKICKSAEEAIEFCSTLMPLKGRFT
jgi:hypothetical protein